MSNQIQQEYGNEKTVKCVRCLNEISATVDNCPFCGQRNYSTENFKKAIDELHASLPKRDMRYLSPTEWNEGLLYFPWNWF